MSRAAVLLAFLALAVAPVAPAAAQLGPNNVPSPLTTPPPPPPAEQDDDGGLSGWQKVLIFGVAAAVLGAIGAFIVRDAHRAAPVEARPRASASRSGGDGGARGAATAPGSTRAREQRARRAKDRAARRQRKRNRPR